MAVVCGAAPVEVTFTWTLGGLTPDSFTGADRAQCWPSPEFVALGVRWVVNVSPANLREGSDSTAPRGVGLHLRLVEPACTVQPAAVSFFWTGAYVPRSLSASRIFSTEGPKASDTFPSWGFARIIPHEALKAAPGKYINSAGEMTITLKIRARTFEAPLPPVPPPSLAMTEAAALLESGEGADVTLCCAGGERVAAHSFMLAARSSTLKAQLWGPLASKRAPPHTVNVPEDIAPEVLHHLLRFIYTDEAPDLSGTDAAAQLLQAADYYDVPRACSFCEHALRDTLTADNAVDTLLLAHAHAREELRASVLRFIAAHASAGLASAAWGQMLTTRPELVHAVMHTMAHGEPPVKVAAAPAAAAPSIGGGEGDPPPAKRARSRTR